MNLSVRGVEPYAVQKIDELAKRSGMSRNLYLKKLIESASVLDELREQEERYARLVEMLAGIIRENTTSLEKVSQLAGYGRLSREMRSAQRCLTVFSIFQVSAFSYGSSNRSLNLFSGFRRKVRKSK